MPSLPQNGVQVTLEGPLVRLLFDFTPATPVLEDGEEAPDDLFDCESVDTTDRSYGGIVSAIINDRYSQDRVQAIEYHDFQDYREHAKTVARLAVAKIEE